jgi:hypothetical protein
MPTTGPIKPFIASATADTQTDNLSLLLDSSTEVGEAAIVNGIANPHNHTAIGVVDLTYPSFDIPADATITNIKVKFTVTPKNVTYFQQNAIQIIAVNNNLVDHLGNPVVSPSSEPNQIIPSNLLSLFATSTINNNIPQSFEDFVENNLVNTEAAVTLSTSDYLQIATQAGTIFNNFPSPFIIPGLITGDTTLKLRFYHNNFPNFGGSGQLNITSDFDLPSIEIIYTQPGLDPPKAKLQEHKIKIQPASVAAGIPINAAVFGHVKIKLEQLI